MAARIEDGGTGPLLHLTPEFWLFARITCAANPAPDDSFAGYEGEEVLPGPNGTWIDPENPILFHNGTAECGSASGYLYDQGAVNPIFEANGRQDVAIGTIVQLFRGFRHGGAHQDSPGQEWVFFADGGMGGGGGVKVKILDDPVLDPDTGIPYFPAALVAFRPAGSPAGDYVPAPPEYRWLALWPSAEHTPAGTFHVSPFPPVGSIFLAADTGESVILDYLGGLAGFTASPETTAARHLVMQARAQVDSAMVRAFATNDPYGNDGSGDDYYNWLIGTPGANPTPPYILDWPNAGDDGPVAYWLGIIQGYSQAEPGNFDAVGFVWLTSKFQVANAAMGVIANGVPLLNAGSAYEAEYMQTTVTLTVDLQDGPGDTPLDRQHIVTITADLYETSQFPSVTDVRCLQDGDGNWYVGVTTSG